MKKRHRIQFPKRDAENIEQDEAFFYLLDPAGKKKKIRFHDYDVIYSKPDLY